jgi:hypothetical protein
MENDGKIFTPHAWKGVWNRPMKIDERGLHPFTIARMTDHNVRGTDAEDDVVARNETPPKNDVDLDGYDDLNDPSDFDQAA